MYAYQRQEKTQRRLHVVPQKRKKTSVVIRQPRVIKPKTNYVAQIFRLSVVFSFLALFMYFVFPTCYHRLIKQVFYPQTIKQTTENIQGMAVKNWSKPADADLYSIAYPIVNYISNDMFLNRLLLTPTIQKMHSEVTTMYHTTEMSGLKTQLNNLASQYPMIKPSIYVWEYENGK